MHRALESVTENILASYESVGGINNIDGVNLPSKRGIAVICEDLLQVLFPGFHDQEPIHSAHLRRVTAHRIKIIVERLAEEICKSLRTLEPDCPRHRAEDITVRFIKRFPDVRQILQTDVQAAYEGDPASLSFDEIILAYPCLEAIAIQRLAHILYDEKVPLVPRIMTEWAHSRTGIDIHPGAQIGSYFFIDHGTGVVVGETCIIGNRVKLYQGVSLIARSLSAGRRLIGSKRHPTVGDDVTIYAGTTIMGGDTVVGEGSTIGANVFLTETVAPRSLVYYEEKQLKVLAKPPRPAA
jgi:serine O-acetyltransferase